MAVSLCPSAALRPVHETVTLKTADRHDHSYCGIIFPIQCKTLLPIERIIITSISVRGKLGNVTVWVSNDTEDEENDTLDSAHYHYPNIYDLTKRQKQITIDPENWTRIYSNFCPPSKKKLYELDLSNTPIVIRAGQVRGVYIHSTLSSDKSIVYDNYYRSSNRSFDSNIRILPALAHLSSTPFSYAPLWRWGHEAWRYDRKFVGQIDYSILYKLWNPSRHFMFGDKFQCLTTTLFACQRRQNCLWSQLSDECIFLILNMCKWDWGGDDAKDMVESYKRKKEKAKKEALERLKEEDDSYDSSDEIFMSDHHILYQESEDDDFDLEEIIDNDFYEIVVLSTSFVCFFSMFAGIFFGYLVP